MSSTQDLPTAELPVLTQAPPSPLGDEVTWAPTAHVAPPGPFDEPMSGRRWAAIGLVVALTLLVTFGGYELWFSGLLQSRSQSALLAEFKHSLVLDDTPELVTPAEGDPLGVIEIPRFGGEQMIVQGIGSDDTKLGPGHDPSSPAPGQAGNAVVIGRRSTYGAPFEHLNSMKPGDSVIITTRQGQFLYSVVSVKAAPLGDVGVAAATTDDRLTLITAAGPFYRPDSETVVVAKLHGDGLQAPGPLPLRASGELPGSSTQLNGRWGSMLLWGFLLAAAIAAALYLYRRRWNAAVTYLLTTPVLITLAILFYRSVDTLLSPTL